MTTASSGVIANFLPNEYYLSEEAYLYAFAEVGRDEYRAKVDSGLLLQIDCPELAMTRITQFSHLVRGGIQENRRAALRGGQLRSFRH